PPAADPLQRLQWAEAIMAIQVSPMPLFDQTLRKIARTIEQDELAELAALPEPPENMQHGALGTGVERLFAALAWVLDPECYCDKRWSQSRLLLEDAEGTWLQDAEVLNLVRAVRVRHVVGRVSAELSSKWSADYENENELQQGMHSCNH
ncbi:unnamed protein product, partial [Cladocopium goreaui]